MSRPLPVSPQGNGDSPEEALANSLGSRNCVPASVGVLRTFLGVALVLRGTSFLFWFVERFQLPYPDVPLVGTPSRLAK